MKLPNSRTTPWRHFNRRHTPFCKSILVITFCIEFFRRSSRAFRFFTPLTQRPRTRAQSQVYNFIVLMNLVSPFSCSPRAEFLHVYHPERSLSRRPLLLKTQWTQLLQGSLSIPLWEKVRCDLWQLILFKPSTLLQVQRIPRFAQGMDGVSWFPSVSQHLSGVMECMRSQYGSFYHQLRGSSMLSETTWLKIQSF